MQACEQCRLQLHAECIVKDFHKNHKFVNVCQHFNDTDCSNITEVNSVELERSDTEFILANSLYGQVLISQFVSKFLVQYPFSKFSPFVQTHVHFRYGQIS